MTNQPNHHKARTCEAIGWVCAFGLIASSISLLIQKLCELGGR